MQGLLAAQMAAGTVSTPAHPARHRQKCPKLLSLARLVAASIKLFQHVTKILSATFVKLCAKPKSKRLAKNQFKALGYLAHVDLVDDGVGGGGRDAGPGRHRPRGPHVPDQLPPPEIFDQSDAFICLVVQSDAFICLQLTCSGSSPRSAPRC